MWQTGQSGLKKFRSQKMLMEGKTDCQIPSCAQILSHALPVKDMAAFSLDSILRNITAESTDRGFTSLIGTQELGPISLATEHKVWVASHLSHASEPIATLESCGVRAQRAHKLKILE
jgi:hypothetical protein